MKEWTKRDRTERGQKKVPRKNRTLTDWPSLSLRVTAPPSFYSRPTLSSEGNVGQYVRTFVCAFCHPRALWVKKEKNKANLEHVTNFIQPRPTRKDV